MLYLYYCIAKHLYFLVKNQLTYIGIYKLCCLSTIQYITVLGIVDLNFIKIRMGQKAFWLLGFRSCEINLFLSFFHITNLYLHTVK